MIEQIQILFEKGLIDSQQKENIFAHYQALMPKNSYSLPLIALGILAAFLFGSGIILIFAYNWEYFSRGWRTFFSLLPLLLGQGLAVYVLLLRQKPKKLWKEPVALFWFLSIGASIALISQTYHIYGDLEGFFWVWLLAGFAIIYLLSSYAVLVAYIILFFQYAVLKSSTPFGFEFLPIIFLSIVLVPFYYLQMRQKISKQKQEILALSMVVLFWLLFPFRIEMTKYEGAFALLIVVLFSAFLLFLPSLSYSKFFRSSIVGMFFVVASIILLFFATQTFYWQEVAKLYEARFVTSIDAVVYFTIIILGLGFLLWNFYKSYKKIMKNPSQEKELQSYFYMFPLAGNFVLFLVILLSYFPFINFAIRGTWQQNLLLLFFNLYIFSCGIFFIVRGIRRSSALLVNSGFLLATVLIFIRFYDLHMSMLTRGIIFIVLGIFLLLLNRYLLQKSKKEQQDSGFSATGGQA